MFSRVNVIRDSGALERRRWTFLILDFPKVHLEYYGVEGRQTSRHQWRSVAPVYTRLRGDRGVIRIEEEPEVPADVLEEGLEKLRAELRFEVWSRR